MPGAKVQAEIVQPTADVDHEVTEPWFPISGFVFDNPIALDAANGMLDAHSNPRDEAIAHFVRVGQLTASGFLFRLQNRDAFQMKALKACVLGEHTACWDAVTRFISESFIILFAFYRVT